MTRSPVSSATSRTAVSSTCSPESRLPFGKLQSSYLGRWIKATSLARPGDRHRRAEPDGRHGRAPAARISLPAGASGIGDSALPGPDQVLLYVGERLSVLVQVM